MPIGESQVAYAYNRWMVEEFCSQEPRLKFLPFLPLNDPDMCLRMIREFARQPERVRESFLSCIQHAVCTATAASRGSALEGDLGREWAGVGAVPHAAARPRVPQAHVGGPAAQAPAERVHARDVLHVAADGDGPSGVARVDADRDQRRDATRVRLGLATLGLRPPERLPRPAVPRASRRSATSSASTPRGSSASTCRPCSRALMSGLLGAAPQVVEQGRTRPSRAPPRSRLRRARVARGARATRARSGCRRASPRRRAVRSGGSSPATSAIAAATAARRGASSSMSDKARKTFVCSSKRRPICGIAPAMSRTVRGSSHGASPASSPNHAAAIWSRSARVGK